VVSRFTRCKKCSQHFSVNGGEPAKEGSFAGSYPLSRQCIAHSEISRENQLPSTTLRCRHDEFPPANSEMRRLQRQKRLTYVTLFSVALV
jgi:hypothetical protein